MTDKERAAIIALLTSIEKSLRVIADAVEAEVASREGDTGPVE